MSRLYEDLKRQVDPRRARQEALDRLREGLGETAYQTLVLGRFPSDEPYEGHRRDSTRDMEERGQPRVPRGRR